MVSVKESLPDKAVFEQMSGGAHSRQRSQTKEQPGQRLCGASMFELFEEKPRKLMAARE